MIICDRFRAAEPLPPELLFKIPWVLMQRYVNMNRLPDTDDEHCKAGRDDALCAANARVVVLGRRLQRSRVVPRE